MNRTIIPPRLIGILALLTALGRWPPIHTCLRGRYARGIGGQRIGRGGQPVGVLRLAAGQLIYGPLSDRYGGACPCWWARAQLVLASALACVVTRIDAFIALRLLQALGGACG
jgi:DHA1 family bicyclomycin/chloramphenicol resistance-like MFS transporter